jgi:hypothetical protein
MLDVTSCLIKTYCFETGSDVTTILTRDSKYTDKFSIEGSTRVARGSKYTDKLVHALYSIEVARGWHVTVNILTS